VGKRENDTGIFDEERNTFLRCAKFQDWNLCISPFLAF